MLTSAVETAWETILRDQEEKYLEKYELTKNRQCEYLEMEIKSPLLEFTRNDASQVQQHCTFETAGRSAVISTETPAHPWTPLWLFCVPHRTHDFTAPARKKSCSEELDSVARKSLLN